MQVAVVDLHVTGFVHDLGRRVEFCVYVGDRVHDLRGCQQGALLTVQKLRERPGHRLGVELDFLALGETGPVRGAGNGCFFFREKRLFGVNVD